MPTVEHTPCCKQASLMLLPQRLAKRLAYSGTRRLQQPVTAVARSQRQAHSSKPAVYGPFPVLNWLADQIDSLGAAYMFTGATSAWLQGANVQDQQLRPLQVTVQWDFMQELHRKIGAALSLEQGETTCQPYIRQTQASAEPNQHGQPLQHVSEIVRRPGGVQYFTTEIHSNAVMVTCELNRVLQMTPNRVPVALEGRQLWCESLLSIKARLSKTNQRLAAQVTRCLQEQQADLTEANAQAWSQAETADAWGNKVGDPAEAAVWLQQDPLLRLGAPLHKHLPQDLSGIKLVNLMGSNGTKAVAAALLGAQVTCVDISPANVQYGQQLAQAAGVEVQFVVADVLAVPDRVLAGAYDVVLLELGVLHYFLDLQPLMHVIQQLLKPGGMLLLREFHPVSTKLITTKGKKHKVTGDYFAQQLVASEVAYSKYTGDAHEVKKQGTTVRLRQWGLGEVITAVAEAGLMLKALEEEPGVKTADAGLPKVFTLVATKPSCC